MNRAKGKRLSNRDVRKVTLIDPLPYEPPEDEEVENDTEEPVVEDQDNAEENENVVEFTIEPIIKEKDIKPEKEEEDDKNEGSSKSQMELDF